jgi:hypothetical protein
MDRASARSNRDSHSREVVSLLIRGWTNLSSTPHAAVKRARTASAAPELIAGVSVSGLLLTAQQGLAIPQAIAFSEAIGRTSCSAKPHNYQECGAASAAVVLSRR